MKFHCKMFAYRLKYVNNLVLFRALSTEKKSIKSSKVIRQEFLNYFIKQNNHAFVRSSPVMPLNDPTIPFINAGMNQFKGVLLGHHDAPAFRVANSQKCIRVGGKHNDYETVGLDSYHHTFFEMLGNWSFGDYFKEDACRYAWDLLVNVYGIKKEFLYVTYFGGNEKFNLKPDLECKEIWLNIGVPEDKIIPFGMTENFWEMGPTGPCGPCTEIHIDQAMQGKNQASRVNKGHDDVTELWNIVFIQYQRLTNGQIIPLHKKHVDTGMGFERLVTVLQEKRSNYDTDLFEPYFDVISNISHAPRYQGCFGNADKDKIDTAYRILADHARMVTVALADGVLPDKNHKLRRILRKAIDISEDVFKNSSLLSELTNHVADNLGDFYPEIHQNLNKIQYIIKYEEQVMKSARQAALKNWKKVVNNRPELSEVPDATLPGLSAGYYELQNLLKSKAQVNGITGEFAFKLYDTYGLNVETISKLAEIESIPFDPNNFKMALENAKKQSRLDTHKTDDEIISEYSLDLLESGNISKTDDSFKYDYSYNGKEYQFPIIKSKLMGIIINGNLISQPEPSLKVDESQAVVEATVTSSGNIVEKSSVVNADTEVGVILDRTSAYSSAGGQISDKGHIQIKNLLFKFDYVKKIRGYLIHVGHFVDWEGVDPDQELRVGDDCLISINEERRLGAMRHHTATHLLNASLKKILPVVGQRGSSVSDNGLDFECSTFGKKLTLKEVIEIENYINETIKANVTVKTKTVNLLQMLKENNLTVIPGEVYPENGIRIVEINSEILNSKEACCGTHLHKTGTLEDFCILNLKSQGASSIYLKALTGPAATLAKLSGENLKDRIFKYESILKSNKVDLKDLELKILSERQKLLDKNKRVKLPYVIVQQSLMQLENLLKIIKSEAKGIRRSSIEEEIKKLLDSSSLPFVVHFFQPNNATLENVSLKNIIKLCPPTTPVFVIIHCDNKIKARCVVPPHLQSSEFNAKMWMEEVLRIFQTKGSTFRDDDPQYAYNMSPTHISNDNFKSLIDKAISSATKFASIYVKSEK
ncbi:hypothetical protein TKK_0009782 [Trichogramma kaykai]|uniref:Alanine--tRNA ligase n=1 Tax=Trichogramma kaykai TaxID=54128 RepID=A0ABD2X176_9HYME